MPGHIRRARGIRQADASQDMTHRLVTHTALMVVPTPWLSDIQHEMSTG